MEFFTQSRRADTSMTKQRTCQTQLTTSRCRLQTVDGFSTALHPKEPMTAWLFIWQDPLCVQHFLVPQSSQTARNELFWRRQVSRSKPKYSSLRGLTDALAGGHSKCQQMSLECVPLIANVSTQTSCSENATPALN